MADDHRGIGPFNLLRFLAYLSLGMLAWGLFGAVESFDHGTVDAVGELVFVAQCGFGIVGAAVGFGLAHIYWHMPGRAVAAVPPMLPPTRANKNVVLLIPLAAALVYGAWFWWKAESARRDFRDRCAIATAVRGTAPPDCDVPNHQ